MLLPNVRQAFEYRLVSSAFIGLPCPKNTAGIGTEVASVSCSERCGGELILFSHNETSGLRANRSSPGTAEAECSFWFGTARAE